MIWLLLIGLLQFTSFSFYGFDKYCAIKKKWRVSERTLLLLALFAPLGALLGMIVFHHKIRKTKFKILVPLFIIFQGVLIYFAYQPILRWIS